MIYDVDNNPIASFSGSISASGTYSFSVLIDCEDGKTLSADTVGDITVEARKDGDVSWTAIGATPIDLSSYAPARAKFNVKLTAGAVTTITRRQFALRVS